MMTTLHSTRMTTPEYTPYTMHPVRQHDTTVQVRHLPPLLEDTVDGSDIAGAVISGDHR